MHSTVKRKRRKGILLKEEEESQIRGEIFFAPKMSNNKSRHVEIDGGGWTSRVSLEKDS